MNISHGESPKGAFEVVVYHVALAAFAVIGLLAIGVLTGTGDRADQANTRTRIIPPPAFRYVDPDEGVSIVLVNSVEQKAQVELSMDQDANHIAELGISVPKPAIVMVKGTASDELIAARWQDSSHHIKITDLTLP